MRYLCVIRMWPFCQTSTRLRAHKYSFLAYVFLLSFFILLLTLVPPPPMIRLRTWLLSEELVTAKNQRCQQQFDQLTVVTAFFDIGTFVKGKPDMVWNATTYHRWMTVFRRLENPLVVYVDNDKYANFIEKIIRNCSSRETRIIKLNRTRMWSFNLVPQIAEIYSQADYPKFHPNTVIPEYSAVMHAKYEVLEMAIFANPFRTKYFCWLDVGLFRDLVNSAAPFTLALPPGHLEDSVSVNMISDRKKELSPLEIVAENEVWIGGGFFVARWDVMLTWIQEYMSTVETMIARKVMSTDQQVIYTAYNNVTHPPTTRLKIYQSDGRFNDWFHLAYVSRESGVECKLFLDSSAVVPGVFSNQLENWNRTLSKYLNILRNNS